jgi:FkbM family methyltransferase
MLTSLNSLAKSIAYGAVDLCTAGRGVQRVICGEVIRFPARWCRWYASSYEPGTFAFVRDRCGPGDTALDIGAHLGLFSIVMARRVGPTGRVFSFEPTPLTREVLTKTVRLNGYEDVIEVQSEAVTGATGLADFFDTGTITSNANSLVRTGRSRGSLRVPTVSLDEFIGARGLRPSCLKVDVEGAELDLLRGARDTFLTCRPAAALSLHPASFADPERALSEIWSVLEDYRMEVRLLEDYGTSGTRGAVMNAAAFCRPRQVFDVELIPAR